MKNSITLLLFVLLAFSVSAQESTKVTMKITYKGNPLCFWDVTLKHGDVVLKEGKTDDNGFVDFGYVRLLSYSVDASGYKKTANGDKNWDVKGYITLNEQGHADFDFLPIVEETGMGGMMEAAWGLTLNDCAGTGGSGNSGSDSSGSGNSGSGSGSSDVGETTTEQVNEEVPFTVDPAQGYQNQRAMYADKISDLDRKIAKKTEERNGVKPDSRDYSELSYDIRDLEIERSITQLKLEKTDKEIANNNSPLDKTQRDYYNQQEETLKQEQKTLKEKRDSGVRMNGDQPDPGVSEEGTEEEFEKFVVYSADELASMNTVNLQKLKLEYQTKLGKRKAVLKTKGSIMKEDKRALLETEISELEKMIELMEAELAKRKDQ